MKSLNSDALHWWLLSSTSIHVDTDFYESCRWCCLKVVSMFMYDKIVACFVLDLYRQFGGQPTQLACSNLALPSVLSYLEHLESLIGLW